jgi:hypothetical protein
MTQPAIMGLLGVFTSLMFFFASFTEIPRLMSFLFYFGKSSRYSRDGTTYFESSRLR